jgi:ectonucleotide pyrophosphatase/phosphodiesterase family protein 6
MKGGVKARFLQPVFPSYSFVNFYSLMTGTYAGVNGMVHNYMWDEKHESEFLVGDNRPEQDQPFWWDDGEPLWITAKKQNKRSYIWYWNGCEVEIRGLRPDFCAAYQDTMNPDKETFEKALGDAVTLLKNDTTDLAAVYWERVDWWGHDEGPFGSNVTARVREMDQMLNDLMDSLQDTDDINMVMFSDHGMAERVKDNPFINVLDYITNDDIHKAYGSKSGPVLQIWPVEGKVDQMYNALKDVQHMTTYKKADIPDKYHLKEHYRVPPLLLVADEGYGILRPNLTEHKYHGWHGYDNELESMRGIFFAYGPDFKSEKEIPGFLNIEVYNVMCKVMGITPHPNNGSLANVCDMLEEGCDASGSPGLTPGLSLILASLLAMIMGSVVY